MSSKEIEVSAVINGLAYGGSFVGQIESGPADLIGKKTFIRGAAAGEKVNAVITADHKRYAEARLISIVNRSGERKAPPCEVFGKCGGCDLQYLSIPAQRRAKLDMIKETLRLKAGVIPENEIELIGPDLPEYNYRNRISLHVGPRGEIGFYRAGSGDVVDTGYCYLASSVLNDSLADLRPFLGALAPVLKGVVLQEKGSGVALMLSLDPHRSTPENLNGIIKELSKVFSLLKVQHSDSEIFNSIPEDLSDAGHFSQVNNEANKLLIQCVKKNVTESKVTELYAGSGNLTFNLAEGDRLIDAVESDPILVKFGHNKARELGLLKRLSFHALSAEQYLKKYRLHECVLLDPPRSGIKNIVPDLLQSGACKIVYVSCSLPTLSRDLKELCNGGFTLKKVYYLDMFPQTHHVETVSILAR